MQSVRCELMPGVNLTQVQTAKFKTGVLSLQLILPLDKETAALGALLPAVLRRGTVRFPDTAALSAELDMLYGAGIASTVRKRAESQCIGFVASFLDDRLVPDGSRLLEPVADLLGELLCSPVTRNGRFLTEYVDVERDNLTDMIRSILDDKRDYADLRLLQEMCVQERYGVDRLGDEQSAERIRNQALCRFYREVLPGARIELFYCGSAEAKRVETALRRALAPLPRGKRIDCALAARRDAPSEPRVIRETMDNITQGKLALGLRASSTDEPALLLANTIFGGYSNSRLFLNVREKLSLCYYASSTYHRAKGIWTVSCGIEPQKYDAALGETLHQLDELKRGALEPGELETAKRCVIDSLRTREDSAGRLEEMFLSQAVTGVTETTEELIAALEAVTPERVAAAAQSVTLDTIYFLHGEEAAV